MLVLGHRPGRDRHLGPDQPSRAAMDPLVLVDDTHFVHRFHVDRPAGTLSIGDPERAKPLVERFDEIWESGEPGVTGTVLGL